MRIKKGLNGRNKPLENSQNSPINAYQKGRNGQLKRIKNGPNSSIIPIKRV